MIKLGRVTFVSKKRALGWTLNGKKYIGEEVIRANETMDKNEG